ncbi:MAG: hypothetical protein IPH55_07280 [Betaproteobacteria bacterium]|nr:hypothetical protein [Betaproteobacteria bacterium]
MRARQMLERLHALEEKQYVDPVTFAQVHGALGEVEVALDWYEKAFADRTPNMVFTAILPGLSPSWSATRAIRRSSTAWAFRGRRGNRSGSTQASHARSKPDGLGHHRWQSVRSADSALDIPRSGSSSRRRRSKTR